MKRIMSKLCFFALLAALVVAFAACGGTTYEIRFDANGGTGTMETAVAEAESEYTLPENGFTAEGKQFMGYRAEGTSELLRPGDKITVTASVTMKAVWGYNVSYTVGSDTQTEVAEEGTMVTVAAAPSDITRPFKGWAVGDTVYQPGDKVTVNGDIAFTIVYDTATVSFAGGNGATGSMAPVTVDAGSEYELPESGFTAAGKQFMGFRAAGSSEIKKPGDKVTVTADVTYTAVWGYTVSYTVGTDTQRVVVEENTSFALIQPTVPEGQLFGGWQIGDDTYQAGEEMTATSDLSFTAALSVDMAPVSGVSYYNAGSTYSQWLRFNADGSPYYVPTFNGGTDDTDYWNFSSFQTGENDHKSYTPFDGVTLKYSGRYSTSDPVVYATVTIRGGEAVVTLSSKADYSDPEFTLYFYAADNAEEYEAGSAILYVYTWENGGSTVNNFFWVDETYPDGIDVEIDNYAVGNIVYVMYGDEQLAEIKVNEGSVSLRGDEAGATVGGYVLDGWGNATKDGQTVTYTVSATHIVIDGVGYRIGADGTYTEEDPDAFQGTFVIDSSSSDYGYILEFDGYGTVYAENPDGYSETFRTGTYTVGEGTISLSGTFTNYTFEVLENSNVLYYYGSSYTYYTFAREGYVSPTQIDDSVSGEMFMDEDGNSIVIDAEAKEITFSVQSYNDVAEYTENYNGSILYFIKEEGESPCVITFTVEDGKVTGFVLDFVYDDPYTTEMDFAKAATITIEAPEGADDLPPSMTAYAMIGGELLLSHTLFIDTNGNEKLVGFTDGSAAYTIGESIDVAGDMTLTAVFAAQDMAPFVGDWYRGNDVSAPYYSIVQTEGSYTFAYVAGSSADADDIVYYATNGKTIFIVEAGYSSNTYYTFTVDETSADAAKAASVGGYSTYDIYRGDVSSWEARIGNDDYTLNRIGSKYFTDIFGAYNFEEVTLAGTVAENEIVTITSAGEETMTLRFISDGGEGLTFIFRGEEADKTTSDGYTLDGWGNATKDDETLSYTVNGAGAVIIGENGYVLEGDVYTLTDADALKGAVFTNTGSSSYEFRFDGFGGAVYVSSGTEYVGTYTVSGEEVTVNAYTRRTFTMLDENVWRADNDFYFRTGAPTTPALGDSEFSSSGVSVTISAAGTIEISGVDTSFDGTYAYTQVAPNAGKFTVSGREYGFVVGEDTLLLQVYKSYSTTIIEVSVAGTLDGWQGTYVDIDYDYYTIIIDGSGTLTIRTSYDDVYVYEVDGDRLRVVDDTGYYTYFIEQDDGTFSLLDSEGGVINVAKQVADGWEGTYSYTVGSSTTITFVLNGDGTGTWDGSTPITYEEYEGENSIIINIDEYTSYILTNDNGSYTIGDEYGDFGPLDVTKEEA